MQAQGRDGEIETRTGEGQGLLVADDGESGTRKSGLRFSARVPRQINPRRAGRELRERRHADDEPSLARQPRGKLRRGGADLDHGGKSRLMRLRRSQRSSDRGAKQEILGAGLVRAIKAAADQGAIENQAWRSHAGFRVKARRHPNRKPRSQPLFGAVALRKRAGSFFRLDYIGPRRAGSRQEDAPAKGA